MGIKEAKEIIRAGFAWAGWTDEQKEAFKLAYESIDNAEQLKKQISQFEKQTKNAIEEIKQFLKEEVKRQESNFAYDDHSATVEIILKKVEEIEKKHSKQ